VSAYCCSVTTASIRRSYGDPSHSSSASANAVEASKSGCSRRIRRATARITGSGVPACSSELFKYAFSCTARAAVPPARISCSACDARAARSGGAVIPTD
jgi:hypothetical protein